MGFGIRFLRNGQLGRWRPGWRYQEGSGRCILFLWHLCDQKGYEVNGGPSRVSRDFEKYRFEPVNDRARCARAGIVLPVQHERSEVVGPVDLNLRPIDYEEGGEPG